MLSPVIKAVDIFMAWVLLMIPVQSSATERLLCDRSELEVTSEQAVFRLHQRRNSVQLEKWFTNPVSQPFAFGTQGQLMLAEKVLLMCFDSESSILLVLQQGNNSLNTSIQAFDAKTGQRKLAQASGRFWYAAVSSLLPQDFITKQLAFPFLQLPDTSLWLGGSARKPFIYKNKVQPSPHSASDFRSRSKRQAQDEDMCLTTSNVTNVETFCSGAETNCGTNNGESIRNIVDTVVFTSIQTNIDTVIRTEVTTRFNSQITTLTRIQTDINTAVTTYIEAETELTGLNRINTEVNAEIATFKAQLLGDFDITNRVAVLEAELEANVETEIDLELQVGQLNLALDAEIETNLALQADLAGAQVEANTLALLGGGQGGGIGILIGLVGSSLLFNRIKTGKWCCW